MKDKIKVIILGTGYGNNVIKPSIGKKDNYEILDIVSPRKLINYKKNKNIEFNNDLRRIFYSNLADCVILAVPPRLQYYFLKHCLKGEKSFICEKPFTFSLSQAKTIHKEIIQSNLKCALGYQFRYDPLIEVFKKLNFELGTPVYDTININWNTSGSLNTKKLYSWRDSNSQSLGVISEWCSHVFDYIHHLTGAKFHEISSFSKRNIEFRKDLKNKLIKVENPDQITINSVLDSGTKCGIEINTAYEGTCHHSISLKKDDIKISVVIYPPYFQENIKVFSNINIDLPLDYSNSKIDTRITSYSNLLNDYFSYFNDINQVPKLPKSLDGVLVWECIEKSLKSKTKL